MTHSGPVSGPGAGAQPEKAWLAKREEHQERQGGERVTESTRSVNAVCAAEADLSL